MENKTLVTGTFDLAILSRMAVEGHKDAQTLIATQLAESIQNNLTEILSDANAETTWKWVACESFSDLHDVCDANMLGETEEVWAALQGDIDDPAESRAQICCDVVNAAQTTVDLWIKGGGLKRELSTNWLLRQAANMLSDCCVEGSEVTHQSAARMAALLRSHAEFVA